METVKMVLLVLAVSITIAYFVFSIRRAFIQKEQLFFSEIDFLYMAFVFAISTFITIFYGWASIAITFILILIWTLILENRLEKNEKIKNNEEES